MFSNKNEIGLRGNKLHCFKVIFQRNSREQHSNMSHYSKDLEPVLGNCKHEAQINLVMSDISQAIFT